MRIDNLSKIEKDTGKHQNNAMEEKSTTRHFLWMDLMAGQPSTDKNASLS